MAMMKSFLTILALLVVATSGVAADECCCANGVSSTDPSSPNCAKLCVVVGSKATPCAATAGGEGPTESPIAPPAAPPVAPVADKPTETPTGEAPTGEAMTCCCKNGVTSDAPPAICKSICGAGNIVKCSADAAPIPAKETGDDDNHQSTGDKIKDKTKKVAKTIGAKSKKAAKSVAKKSKELGNQSKKLADKEAKLLGVEPLVVYLVAGGVGFLLLSLVTYCCCCRKKKQPLDEALKFVPLDTNGQPVPAQSRTANTVNFV